MRDTMINYEKRETIFEYAVQVAAIGDLLTRSHDVPQETVANIGWLVRSLGEQIAESLDSGNRTEGRNFRTGNRVG